MTAVGVAASLAVALLAFLVFGLTVTFGSGGFGGSSVDRSREVQAQVLLAASALGASALVLVRGWWIWLVVVVQLALFLVALEVGP